VWHQRIACVSATSSDGPVGAARFRRAQAHHQLRQRRRSDDRAAPSWRYHRTMAYPWFPIIAWTLVAVLACIAVAASVRVWRAPSLSVPSRAGLIALIAVVAAAAIMWIVFVAPAYMD